MQGGRLGQQERERWRECRQSQQETETETATARATATARPRPTTVKPKAKTTAQKKSKQQPPHQKNLVFLAHTRAAKASSTLNPNICDKNLLSLQKITL